jgi:5-methylcytosine-specific restriction endonuclease McrA
MARNYRKYKDEDIINFSKEVFSIAGLLKKLNLMTVGGNYKNIKKNLQRLKVDTSHWTGQGWNKNQQLKDWNCYARSINFKNHLIKIREHRCEKCSLTEWMDEKIALEIHHKDGDSANNVLENLQLLCPNCHSTTSNWRGRGARRIGGEIGETHES